MTSLVTKLISVAFWVHSVSLSTWLFSNYFIHIDHVSLQTDNKVKSRTPVTFFVDGAHNNQHSAKCVLLVNAECEVTDGWDSNDDYNDES